MARALLKYAFVALFALLSTQAVVPSTRVAAAIEIVCSAKTEQEMARETRAIAPPAPVGPPAPFYVSRTRPQPEAAPLFQRPPPSFLRFS